MLAEDYGPQSAKCCQNIGATASEVLLAKYVFQGDPVVQGVSEMSGCKGHIPDKGIGHKSATKTSLPITTWSATCPLPSLVLLSSDGPPNWQLSILRSNIAPGEQQNKGALSRKHPVGPQDLEAMVPGMSIPEPAWLSYANGASWLSETVFFFGRFSALTVTKLCCSCWYLLC